MEARAFDNVIRMSAQEKFERVLTSRSRFRLPTFCPPCARSLPWVVARAVFIQDYQKHLAYVCGTSR